MRVRPGHVRKEPFGGALARLDLVLNVYEGTPAGAAARGRLEAHARPHLDGSVPTRHFLR
jgi:hypothetical protein